MKTRQLGKTGRAVGELGVGAWALGKEMQGRDALRRLCAALDAGRNFIDTSPAYAEGESEKIVGEAVRELRARDFAVIATRVAQCDAPTPAVVQSAERSLRALRAEAIPLLLVTVARKRSSADPRWAELRGAMEEMIRAGKILHWGIAIEEVAAGAEKGTKGEQAEKTSDLDDAELTLLAEPGVEVVRLPLRELGAARGSELGIVAVGDATAGLTEPTVSVVVEAAW